MSARPAIDAARCEVLAGRAASGDEAAWKELIEQLWPPLRSLVEHSRSMGRFARSEDHVHDVLARLVDRLGRHERRGLGLYAPWRERNPDKTFEDWIQIVTVNEIRRLVRAELARLATSDAEALPSVKRVLNEIAMSPALEELGVRPAMTAAQTARELVVFAEARLPADRYRALRLWMEGATFDEIAADLGLGPTEAAVAQRLVRAALAVVRRHFAAETDEEINS